MPTAAHYEVLRAMDRMLARGLARRGPDWRPAINTEPCTCEIAPPAAYTTPPVPEPEPAPESTQVPLW